MNRAPCVFPLVCVQFLPVRFCRITRIVQYNRNLLHSGSNCTSSKPSSNVETSKQSSFNTAKVDTESIFSIIWKSVAFASSILRVGLPSTSTNNSNADQEKPEKYSFSMQKLASKFIKPHLRYYFQQNTNKAKDQNVTKSITSLKLVKSFGQEFNSSNNSVLEEAVSEWISHGNVHMKKEVPENDKSIKYSKLMVSKTSLESRSRFLVRSLQCALSCSSQMLRLDEVSKHLLQYPQEKRILVKEGLIKVILGLRRWSKNDDVKARARVTLSLLGYHDPPLGDGIRILTIDGGGTRGLMAIEVLRQLQARANKPIHELFDYMCGVSSGAILSLFLGGLQLSLDECEKLYKELSAEVFRQSTLIGTSRLMWYHAYYDTNMWVKVLRDIFGEKLLIDTVKNKCAPKLSAVSAVMNLPALRAFVFRNYDFPLRVQSQFIGSCSYKMWEAIRASGAAPGYFEEFCLDGRLHQDGGIMVNNPTALAIHEALLLWPSDYIQCVFSLGSGRYVPIEQNIFTSTTLKTKVQKVIDSATDTEAVHVGLNDLLPPGTYFRFNPYLTEFLHLDEHRPEKLHQLKMDAQMYLRRNEHKFENSIRVLTKPRNYFKRFGNWLQLQKVLLL